MSTDQIITFLYNALFRADTIWSVVIRAGIWLAVSVVIIASMDKPDADTSFKSLKTNLGFFLFFIVLTSALVWLLFGYVGQPA